MSSRTQASLGRTLMPAVALTTAAAGLVALLDHPSSGVASSAAPVDGSEAIVVGDSVAVQAGTQPPAVSSTNPVAQPVAGETTPAVAAQQPVDTAEQGTATDPATTTAAAEPIAGCTGTVIDGETITTRWGPVQVEAEVSVTHEICSVKAIQSPNSHGKSVRINNAALPVLHKQVLSAQSANIDGVSGATITSGGYERSLQSILDGLGG
jgi:uncharacterized protein with FMN-binding domain